MFLLVRLRKDQHVLYLGLVGVNKVIDLVQLGLNLHLQHAVTLLILLNLGFSSLLLHLRLSELLVHVIEIKSTLLHVGYQLLHLHLRVSLHVLPQTKYNIPTILGLDYLGSVWCPAAIDPCTPESPSF